MHAVFTNLLRERERETERDREREKEYVISTYPLHVSLNSGRKTNCKRKQIIKNGK